MVLKSAYLFFVELPLIAREFSAEASLQGDTVFLPVEF